MELIHHIFVILANIIAVAFCIIGLDDFLFDMQFVRYLMRNRNQRHITVNQLREKPEKLIAIFVPAWMEGGVVNRMAEYAVKVLLYERYEIFVGVYPNDPETCACVDKISAICPKIHKVMVPHPGPTSKADCLNWLYRAMRLREIPGVREYAIIALHDSEDILHPLTLKIYNFFVPRRFDMAQIPVFPLELPPLKYWVGNTYMDDFCETHIKDMYARQQIGGVVPSAGVGTAFTRQTLEAMEKYNQGDPFPIGNLTEDYVIGLQLKRLGYRTGFINFPIDRVVRKKSPDGATESEEIVTEIVAVRENFPREFSAAVRQRSRWILGIAFQSWQQSGWGGNTAIRYTLYRDRRAPLVHIINILGYIILLYPLAEFIIYFTPWDGVIYMPPLFNTNTFLWKVVIVDTCLLFYRFMQKVCCIAQVFGITQALFSIPRFVLNNVINFFATMRALRMFLANQFFGKQLVWLKTSHVFPGQMELAAYTKTIEDLLVTEGVVTKEDLEKALHQQKDVSAPLALLRLGLIDEERFTDIWAKHSGLATRVINPSDVDLDLLKNFNESHSLNLEALPIGKEDGRISIIFREPPPPEKLELLSTQFNAPLLPSLARPSNISFIRNRCYPRLALPAPKREFSHDILQNEAAVETTILQKAMTTRFITGQNPLDILIEMGALTTENARQIWSKSLGYTSCSMFEETIDEEFLKKAGPFFFLLHRMAPLNGNRIATVEPVHPQTIQWLNERLSRKATFVTDLPHALELSLRSLAKKFDADEMLIESLLHNGILKAEDAQSVRSTRQLVNEPVDVIINQLNLATKAQLHGAFIEVSSLATADSWKPEEITRLLPLLRPGFSIKTGCFALQERDGGITLGLEQLPSTTDLIEIHQRLAGYPIFFVALKLEDAAALRNLIEKG